MSATATLPRARGPFRVALFVAVLIALAALAQQQQLSAALAKESGPRVAFSESYMLPPPEALAVLGLGHNTMMADLIWLRALSYFAVHFYLDRDYRWLDRYIDTVIALDPDFRMIYHWAGVVVMYGGQRIDNPAVMASNRFLEMGRQRYPDDWLFNFMLGCNYRYELIPDTDEQARTWRLLGATYLRRAADLPDAPDWLALTALRNLEQYGAREEALSVAAQQFLFGRGQLSATNRAELTLQDHLPSYGENPQLDLRSMVANGLALRQRLPSTAWWRLFDYRRQIFADSDSADGYMPYELRVLLRGEPNRRGWPERTPLDLAFSQTLDAIAHEDF